ncbi:acyl-CoA thioesterase [Bacteroidota bacterium]
MSGCIGGTVGVPCNGINKPVTTLTDATLKLEPRTVAESTATMTEYVLPNDTNTLGNLMGGRLMHLMDICAAITSQRHTRRVCVTASVDNVVFRSPIRLGEIVILESYVNRAFNTSMEIEVRVWAENPLTGERREANTAYFTFVAVDEEYHKTAVPPIKVETKEHELRYEAAQHRRDLRMILSGRKQLSDADHLRDYLLSIL